MKKDRILMTVGFVWGALALIIGIGIADAFFKKATQGEHYPLALGVEEAHAAEMEMEIEVITIELDEISPFPPIKNSVVFETGVCPGSSEDILLEYDVLIDKQNDIGEYVPPSLVDITPHIRTKGGQQICLEELTALYLRDMLDAAAEEDLSIIVTSGYRSRHTQAILRENSLKRFGDPEHDRVAEAGHSEHQLGTAVDFAGAGNNYISAGRAFAYTEEYAWLLANAHDYGFYLSYPEGQEDETGYIFEPWHWRFWGFE